MHKLIKSWAFYLSHSRCVLPGIFYFGVSHIIKNKATNVLRRQICWDASSEWLHAVTLASLSSASVLLPLPLGSDGRRGGLRPLCDTPLIAGCP